MEKWRWNVGNLQVIRSPIWGVLWGLLDRRLGLYVGNLQIITGSMRPAVCWQPTGHYRSDNVCSAAVWGCTLATYRSLQVLWGLLYVGNLQVITGPITSVRPLFGAVRWQPTDHYRFYEACCMLATYRSLQFLWGLFYRLRGCMLASYRSLQVLWGRLDRLWGCMLATYRLYDAFWTAFGSHQFQGCALFSRVKSLSMLAVGASNLFSGYINPKLRKISWSSCAIIYHTVW